MFWISTGILMAGALLIKLGALLVIVSVQSVLLKVVLALLAFVLATCWWRSHRVAEKTVSYMKEENS